MAINRALRDSAFEPQDREQIIAAYEDALRLLHLANRDDPATEIIARRIVEAARTGLLVGSSCA